MQYKDEKSLQLRAKLVEIIRKIREDEIGISNNRLANEYGLNDSNLSKIERAEIDCKFVTFWKIAEALGLKPSEFVKILEQELGEDFTLIDE